MKIALVCPSNILYMPYIQYYIKIFNELGDIDYDIINWDRFNTEENNDNVYKDSKIGHRRNFIDYCKYSKFTSKRLNYKTYDKLIIFGIQLSYFMKKMLVKSYPNKYIVDIRDYNKVMTIFNMKDVIEQSIFTVISSPGFINWLPKSDKYIVSHNTTILRFEDLKQINTVFFDKDMYNLSYIGSLRDYVINTKIIDSLKHSSKFCLYYHGDGLINSKLKEYLTSNQIKNVKVTGRYSKVEEEELYEKSDLVNVLIPYRDKNSRTLLPNRLYNAVKYGKPIITLDGTFTADLVKKYNLGIVLSSFYNIEENVLNYISNFNIAKFDESRAEFTRIVLADNNVFTSKVINFVGGKEI